MIRGYIHWLKLNEMSISDDKLKEYDTVLNNISDYKKISSYLNDLIIELKNELINSDIKFKEFEYDNDKIYIRVKYNNKIINIIDIFEDILNESKGSDIYDKYYKIIYPDGQENSFYVEVDIEVDNLNRIHVPVGLPLIIKGIGMGKKIYKSLIYELDYLSTTSLNRSMDSLYVWGSLRKDEEIYTFINEQNILCICPNLEFHKIEELLVKFYKIESNNMIIDDDFRDKYLKDVRESMKINKILKY